MLTSYLPPDVHAFIDEEDKVTDILRFRNLTESNGEEVEVEILASFNTLFNHVTAHQNRIICDAFVFDFETWSELCVIETKYNCLAVSPMFHQLMLIGHDRYR